MNIWQSDVHRADGYCFGLSANRRLDDDDEVLEGWLYMHDSVHIAGVDDLKGYVARLKIKACSTPETGDQESPIILAAALGVFVEDDQLHLTVSLQQPPEVLQKLKVEMTRGAVLALEACFASEEYRAVRLREGKQHSSANLTGVALSSFAMDPSLEALARASLSRHLSAMLAPNVLGTSSSQSALIAQEMCEQASRAANLRNVDITALVYTSTGVLHKARDAFLAYGAEPDSEHLRLSLKPKEFMEGIARLDDSQRYRLQAKYTTLWKHFSIIEVILRGQAKSGAQAEGMTYDVEELEALARLLASLPHLYSKTLAWATANALVYAECLAFAQTVAPGKTIAGILIAGELQGLSPGKTWRKAVWKSATSFLVEALKIGTTFFIASALTSHEPMAAWIVTTGVTAARWVVRALGVGKLPETIRAVLLTKMIQAHESLRRQDFHAGVAMSELKSATAQGAVFSPWVYHVLDLCEKSPSTAQ